MTRVLIVLASAERRGAEVEGAQLAAELISAGLDAEVVALHAGANPSLEVETLGSAPLAVSTLRALRAAAKGVDVVVAYGSTTLPACALALLGRRTPFVYRSIGDPARWSRGRFHRWRTGVLFRRAAQVVALWPEAAESIRRLYRVPADRITCIANARPEPDAAAVITREAAREALGLPADATVVAWVGALADEKRPLLAVASVAATDGAFLLIAGEGPLRSTVAAACARELPGRHVLAGLVVPLAPVWAAADAVLLTSRTEGMPGVLIEAALHGVPAVATDVGAVRQIVLDGVAGRVVAEGADASVIAAALREVVVAHAEFGAAAERHVHLAFVWQSVLPEWLRVLASVARRRR